MQVQQCVRLKDSSLASQPVSRSSLQQCDFEKSALENVGRIMSSELTGSNDAEARIASSRQSVQQCHETVYPYTSRGFLRCSETNQGHSRRKAFGDRTKGSEVEPFGGILLIIIRYTVVLIPREIILVER